MYSHSPARIKQDFQLCYRGGLFEIWKILYSIIKQCFSKFPYTVYTSKENIYITKCT